VFWLGNLRLLGRPRRRWEGHISRDIKEIGWKGVEWIYLAHGRDQWWAVVNIVTNLQIP